MDSDPLHHLPRGAGGILAACGGKDCGNWHVVALANDLHSSSFCAVRAQLEMDVRFVCADNKALDGNRSKNHGGSEWAIKKKMMIYSVHILF
mmetsp:Transcript_18341/g.28409  ORF Transcript_18341/g.28409 Transcript_18341/m.28409 type:complete len:92 (-) Transcript_18341:296-571(-)